MTNDQLQDNTETTLGQIVHRLRASIDTNIRQLCSKDVGRNTTWRFEAAGITVDLSRTPLQQALLHSLCSFAESRNLGRQIQQLFEGTQVNTTEQRPAHHTALRDIFDDSTGDHQHEAATIFARVCSIADQINKGQWLGSKQQPIRDVIHIGIGGSDLGPRLLCSAFPHRPSAPNIHFVANIDPAELAAVLPACSPSTTLVSIASKSFTTTETLANANAVKDWLLTDINAADLNHHLIALTADCSKAVAFGVSENNILPLWDWVGGRYSLWSAIGLPAAIALGSDQYRALLHGAHQMDQHFAHAAPEQNIPVLLALLDFLYINVLGAQSVAVLPYSHRLRLLPDYLQQLYMESNGKRVDRDGQIVDYLTCPVVWGGAGTVGQHSFHQLLHQGTSLVPADFILPLHGQGRDGNQAQHRQLVANCLAQSRAFIEGKSEQQALDEMLSEGVNASEAKRLAPHQAIPGNRPNTLIAMEELSPSNLGALLSMYEHKVYVSSVLWNINAFDQWGVELGKQMSKPIYKILSNSDTQPDKAMDSITQYWIDRCKK